jgi:hypothetical protein
MNASGPRVLLVGGNNKRLIPETGYGQVGAVSDQTPAIGVLQTLESEALR